MVVRVIEQLVTCSSVLNIFISFQESTKNEVTEKDNLNMTRTCEDGRFVYLLDDWFLHSCLCSFLLANFCTSCRVTSSNEGIERKKSDFDSQNQTDACTPLPTLSTYKGEVRTKVATSKKHETAKKIAGMVKNPSALKARSQLQLSQPPKNVKPNSVKR